VSTYTARVRNYSTLTPGTIGTIVGLTPCTLTLATQPSNTPLKPMRDTITKDTALDCPINTDSNKHKNHQWCKIIKWVGSSNSCG